MDPKDKQQLSESDICDLFITPALKEAGWDPLQQIRREVTLTPGPVVVRGNLSSRNKKKKKFADYVLSWEPGIPVAVVEAKDNTHSISHGLQQALGYATILDVPSAFSSSGDGFAAHNKVPHSGEEIETEVPLHEFPGPSTLWQRYKQYRGVPDQAEPLLQPTLKPPRQRPALLPVAEQERIVAKVEELRTNCELLKARTAELQTTQLHLTYTIAEQAVA